MYFRDWAMFPYEVLKHFLQHFWSTRFVHFLHVPFTLTNYFAPKLFHFNYLLSRVFFTQDAYVVSFSKHATTLELFGFFMCLIFLVHWLQQYYYYLADVSKWMVLYDTCTEHTVLYNKSLFVILFSCLKIFPFNAAECASFLCIK